MINYEWSFLQFDVVPSEDGLTNVVQTIHWNYTATDGQYVASAYGTVGLGAPDPQNFVPYDSITEQWAIDQTSSMLDVPEMKTNLANQIEAQKNPPIVPMAPPFTQSGA